MSIQMLISEAEKELRHLSDIHLKTKDLNSLIQSIYKCLYVIILIFLTFVEQFGKNYSPLKNLLQEFLNHLVLLNYSDKESTEDQRPEEMKLVHVSEYTVKAHDELRPAHHHPHRDELDMDQAIAEILGENEKLQNEIDEYAKKLDQSKQENKKLNKKLTNLTLLLDSETSNTPSSKQPRYLQGYRPYRNGEKKAHEEADKTKTQKRPGGRPGHPGYKALVGEEIEPTRIIPCYPEGMSQEEIDRLDWSEGACHDYIDLKTETILDRYVQMQTYIPGKRGPKLIKGTFPKNAHAQLSYGTGIEREVFILHSIGFVSMKNISDLLKDAYGLTITPSTINNIISSTSNNFIEVSQMIANKLQEQAEDKDQVFQMDETSVNIDSVNYWDHILLNKDYALHTIDRTRGLEGSRKSGVFDKIKGTVVSDFFNNYINKDFNNAFCWAHLERDLEAASIRSPDEKWIDLMKDFAEKSYLAWKKAHRNHTKIPQEELENLLKLYDKAVQTGILEEDSEDGECQTLLKRFRRYKPGIIAHLLDPELPRTNNAAEKLARSIKRKIDVSNLFKTTRGAENYAALLSVIDTAKLQGLNPIEVIDQIIGGNLDYLFTHKKDKTLSRTASKIVKVKKFERKA